MTIVIWDKKSINSVTGDEPHYLVMTEGLIKYQSFEQTKPYKDEFESRTIYKGGLAPAGAEPRPENTHAVIGPNGLFNVHNIGLPILLIIPYLLGGIWGAKALMIAIASATIYVVWRIAERIDENDSNKFWIVLLCCFSALTIPHANQIYPDLPAGLISLIGIYWLFTINERRSIGKEAMLVALIAFLPWLQIKFGVTSFVLILSIVAKIFYDTKNWKRIITILIVAGVSFLLLLVYNNYAFGKITGPYQDGALEISKTSLIVLLGLLYDQNQGFLFQNLLFFFGLIGIGIFFHANRFVSVAWAFVFLSLIVPNSMHPNWYGGGSFAGRFGLSAAIVFIIPTIFSLSRFINTAKPTVKWFTISLGLAIQAWLFYFYTILGVNLYNKGQNVWPDMYSNYYFPLDSYLPMLYNLGWAYSHLPNYSWLVTILLLIFYGFSIEIIRKRNAIYGIIALVLLIISSGFFNKKTASERLYAAAEFPSKTGRVINSIRVEKIDTDKLELINFGPYLSSK